MWLQHTLIIKNSIYYKYVESKIAKNMLVEITIYNTETANFQFFADIS